MRKSGGTLFDLPKPARSVALNNEPVAGWIKRDSERGEISALVIDRSVPDEFDWSKISSITIKHPFFGNERLATIGGLTAAYLGFFSVFGYSWVMSLGARQVLEQIRNPSENLLEGFYINVKQHKGNSIGVAQVNGLTCLFCAFENCFVLLPPRQHEGFYEHVCSILEKPPLNLKFRFFEPLPDALRWTRSSIVVEKRVLMGLGDAPAAGELAVYTPSLEHPFRTLRIKHRVESASADNSSIIEINL